MGLAPVPGWESERRSARERSPRPMQVLTVANNKGGVGKTTVTNNLAIYMRALRPELPILVVGLDDQPMPDRMFALDCDVPSETVATGLRRGSLDAAILPGQYGVHYVPSSPEISDLKREIRDPFHLEKTLAKTDWDGLVLIDTKSDFEILTQNAVAASDLTLVTVTDQPSMIEAQKVFDLMERLGHDREQAQVLLTLVDRHIRYSEGGETRDVLDLLASEVRRRGYPLLETFLSRSPKVEALATNLRGRPLSILHDAPDTLVHEQMGVLAENLLATFEAQGAQSEAEILESLRGGPPGGAGAHIGAPDSVTDLVALLKPLTTSAGVALGQAALHLTRFPLRIGRLEPGVENDLAITDFPPYQLSRNHAQIVRIMGQIGVIDLGSHHGTWVDERRLGGSTGDPGPAFFTGTGGVLILGKKRSPYAFEVVLGSPVGR